LSIAKKYIQQKKINYYIGQIGGISFQNNGNLLVFHRGKRSWTYSSFLPGNKFNTLLYGPIKESVLCLIDVETKRRIDSWGSNRFYMPHGLTVDFEGNIWLTDVGTHQVFKFNFEKNPFEPLLVIGEELTSGNDESHFCKPTSVSISKINGDIFVADGYCNSRIAQFDKNGKFIKDYKDEEKPIQVVHSIALIESSNVVCTVSREEGRIICFDIYNGKKSYELTDPDMKTVYSIKYDYINDVIHAITGENKGFKSLGITFDANKSRFGKIIQKWEVKEYNLAEAHDMALSPDGSNIYIGLLNGEIYEMNYQ